MKLRPCSGCARHVRVDERACPFCNAAQASSLASFVQPLGRLSRAAVFAGAAACYTSSTPAQRESVPPPLPEEQVVVESPPPPPPGDDSGSQTFAKPPPSGRASVSGVVRYGGAVRPGVEVHAQGRGETKTTTTDARGAYRFTDLEPGTYTLATDIGTNGRFERRHPQVGLASGDSKVVDINVPPPPPPDRGPCCKPYGAPPARRRVV